MRIIVYIGLMLFTLPSMAQHAKLNIPLRLELEKHNDVELFPLFVIGDASKIKAEVRRLEGEVVRSVGKVVQVKLAVGHIENFSKHSFVESIPYAFGKGETMSDTMTIHNNVTPIHNGASPLLQAYTGKGVVFGVIDTGHDIVHPDFRDSSGYTRIYRIWDQVAGVYWDSTSINNMTCTHTDYSGTDHGTHVSGIGAGNGLALNKYAGVATEATIVAVASDFNAPNWLSTVVDAADYIYSVADSLGLPCVINASIGTYFGSHDGTDPAALLIDSLVNYKPGRAFVCAAGNAGFFNWHVEQNVTSDTSFTWLKYNPSSSLGFGSVFFEVWADTADFNNVQYAFGANLPSGSFEERGRTPFFNIQGRMGTFHDTIKNGSNVLAVVETFGELQGDKYLLQVLLNEPDSNTYNFSILSTGSGRFDFWSTNLLGTSQIVETGLPSVGVYPSIAYYTLPDSLKTMVSSFQNSPNVLTVANFVNRKTYLDVDSVIQVRPWTPGDLSTSSSRGPDRRGNLKPDIGATGDVTIGPNSAAVIAANMASTPQNRAKVAAGAMHRINGGTSMASPVIAGIAALYLEKCPSATMQEIKAAITSVAISDSQTGAVPNVGFGHGKVDAFAVLNTSNFTLSLAPDRNVCEGDSIQLLAGSYSSYSWYNGDTSSSIHVDTSAQVYVLVTNSSGCAAISDTIAVNLRPLPSTGSINVVSGDSLYYSSNLNLQWYYNGSLIPLATDTFHNAINSGDYYVLVTDSFGCENTSDTVNVIISGIEQFEQNVGAIYPNPSSGLLTVQMEEELITGVVVYNSIGKLVHQENQAPSKRTQLDLSALPQGSYLIEISTNRNKHLKRLVLLH